MQCSLSRILNLLPMHLLGCGLGASALGIGFTGLVACSKNNIAENLSYSFGLLMGLNFF